MAIADIEMLSQDIAADLTDEREYRRAFEMFAGQLALKKAFAEERLKRARIVNDKLSQTASLIDKLMKFFEAKTGGANYEAIFHVAEKTADDRLLILSVEKKEKDGTWEARLYYLWLNTGESGMHNRLSLPDTTKDTIRFWWEQLLKTWHIDTRT